MTEVMLENKNSLSEKMRVVNVTHDQLETLEKTSLVSKIIKNFPENLKKEAYNLLDFETLKIIPFRILQDLENNPEETLTIVKKLIFSK